MTKAIVFSDSHGELRYMLQAVDRELPDMILHLGDHDADAAELGAEYPLLPMLVVRGNCDWTDTPRYLVTVIEGVRIFLCHGHTYGVKEGLMRAIYAALEKQADVLLFGHTHEPFCGEAEGGELKLLNPGTCGPTYDPTYGILELDKGRCRACWKRLNEEERA